MLASAKGTCTNASYNHTRKPTHSLCGQYKCHCVKSVRIRGFFGPNKGKYRPKKLQIRTIFTECVYPLKKKF